MAFCVEETASREFTIVHKNKLFAGPSTDKEAIDDDENGLLDVVREGGRQNTRGTLTQNEFDNGSIKS